MSTDQSIDSSRTVTAALRISAPVTKAQEIAERLAVKPTRLVEKGKSPARESRWIYESSSTSEDIEAHIDELIALMERNGSGFSSLPPDCQIDIWCTINMEKEFLGFSLPSNLMQRAVALTVDIVFSVYGNSARLTGSSSGV